MPRGRPPKYASPTSTNPKALTEQLERLPARIEKSTLFFKPPINISELYKDETCFSILDAKLLVSNDVEFAELRIELPYEGEFITLMNGENRLAAILVKYFQNSKEKIENVCFKFKSKTLYMEQVKTNATKRN